MVPSQLPSPTFRTLLYQSSPFICFPMYFLDVGIPPSFKIRLCFTFFIWCRGYTVTLFRNEQISFLYFRVVLEYRSVLESIFNLVLSTLCHLPVTEIKYSFVSTLFILFKFLREVNTNIERIERKEKQKSYYLLRPF